MYVSASKSVCFIHLDVYLGKNEAARKMVDTTVYISVTALSTNENQCETQGPAGLDSTAK